MRKANLHTFFNNLTIQQLTQWQQDECRLFSTVIWPSIQGNPATRCFYTHYMTLEGPMFVSLDIDYRNYAVGVSRNIKSVRVYESEFEMDFYMALSEYENTLEPNPVLFNGQGTRADLGQPFVDMFLLVSWVFDKDRIG